jgi:type II secretory pathway pseudopilin PulG
MTLVEVLLAIVILGVSLIALVDGASQALSVVRQARNYEMARRMLGQVEAESPLRLMDEISAGQESGAFQSGPSGWTWAREIVDVSEGDEDDQRAGLFLVTTRVSWSHGRRSGSEEVTQYLYVPEDSDGTRTLKPRTL